MFILLAQTTQQLSGNALDIAGQTTTISPIGTISQLIGKGADAVLLAGTLAVLLYLLLGAFKWITAGGEKGKIEEARNMMTQAIIGVVILASVFAVYRFVINFIGLNNQIQLTGGAGNGSGTGGGGNNPICTIGQSASDGGAGGYCNGGSARVVCTTTTNISYLHWEPVCCLTGTPNTSYTFVAGPVMCN